MAIPSMDLAFQVGRSPPLDQLYSTDPAVPDESFRFSHNRGGPNLQALLPPTSVVNKTSHQLVVGSNGLQYYRALLLHCIMYPFCVQSKHPLVISHLDVRPE